MADYGLPDPVLAGIQGGFAPDPNAPSGVSMAPDVAPPMDATALHPAILSYLMGQPQGDIYLHGPRDGSGGTLNPPPPPPPPPPPSKGMGGGGQGPGTLSLGAAPIAPGLAGAPQAAPEVADTVPSITGGTLPTEPVSLTPPPQQEVPTQVQMPTQAEMQQRAAQDAAAKKQAAAQAAFAASPEGISEKADAQQRAGLAQQAQANTDATQAQMAANDATTKALQAHQQRVAAQEKIDAQKQAEDAANVAKYTQQYAQQVQDAANYHVNDDRSVGAGGLIAIALSGIGNALDHYHGPNAAAQIIEQNINNRIADQWRQKDALAKKATGTANVINQFRAQSDDDRQAQQLHTAAELQKTSDDLKLVAAQSANPTVKANAMNTAGLLTQKAAAITQGEAVRKAQAIRDQKDDAQRAFDNSIKSRQVGLEAQAQNRADQEFAFKKQQWKDQIDAAKNALVAKGKADEAAAFQKHADQVQQWGISDPGTGNFLLQPAGQAKMAKADQLEAQARQQTDPSVAQQMRQQAADLRADANVNDVPTITNPEEHKEIVDNMSANQTLIDRIDEIQKQLTADPSGLDRSKWAALKADWEEAKKDYVAAAATGSVTLSTRSMDAVDKAFGPDPDSFLSREGSVSKMQAALKTINQAAIDDVTTKLRSHHIKANWVPHAPEVTTPSLDGETAQELGTGNRAGFITSRLMFDPDAVNAQREVNAENSAPFTVSGLAPKDEQTVRGLMAQSASANDAKYNDIVDQLASFAQSKSKGSNVRALLRENPKLYDAVFARLPPDLQAQVKPIDDAANGGLGFNPLSFHGGR